MTIRTAKAAPTRRATSGFSNPAFARIGELAQLHAGLVFPPNRQPSAEAGMRRAMSALRIGEPDALLRAFQTPGDARDAVLAELTVGESYFFRDEAQLELLTSDIIPARLESHGASRPLRIWSAGSASGEEAYTLAIMLREQKWPHPARILGTDIALPRLAAARRGRYTRWALRGVSSERIARWFAHDSAQYDLDPSVRKMVEFRPLNLVADDYATPERGAGGFDLVLCRNVMIYFELEMVAHIARGLLDSLAPDGWLVLGASDPMLVHLVPCEAVMTESGVAYRRPGRTHPTVLTVPARALHAVAHEPVLHVLPAVLVDRTPSLSSELALRLASPVLAQDASPLADAIAPSSHGELLPPRADEESEHARAAYAIADYPAAEAMAIAALAKAPVEDVALALWIVAIRSVANQGRLNEAGELCARSLELHPLSAELQYLHATLLTEAGWFSDAAAASRRAIYLDRAFVMAHLLLGDVLARTGDPAAARIAFANVLHLLANTEADAAAAAADGVPVARLRQVAELRLRTLAAGWRHE
ncbi:MAG: protein-glutamate O-methyltransferase CheR [Polaromonas sp.]|nr:protein-glutamate O-methyltransferase CheR [Gemmatimonadaceae bacterium]